MDFRKKVILSIFLYSFINIAVAENISAENQQTSLDVISPVIEQDSQGFVSFIDNRLSLNIEANYYDWQGDNNINEGNQLFIPITLSYKEDNTELGIRTAYIDSENNTKSREGDIKTLSDTNLSFAYTYPINNKTSLRLNTEWNLPTGTESLESSEKNAVMDGALVSQIRFGEGLNTTVGLSLVHNLRKNLILGAGYGYTKLGEYDPNADYDNDTLDPGDQQHVTFQTQYNGERYLFLGGATYTTSDETDFSGRPYYEKGARLDANLAGVYAITSKDRMVSGIRYSTQDADKFINRVSGNFEQESKNINGDSIYAYTEYAREYFPNHTIKANVSYLDVDANSYDFANDLYNAGRQKLTYGIGYDWKATKNTTFKASIKRYEVEDKATLATGQDSEYSGWNTQLGLKTNF